MTEPPRLARHLLARALPADARDDIVGDLEELFHRRAATHGAARARLWYVAESARVAGRLLWERARERRAAETPGTVASGRGDASKRGRPGRPASGPERSGSPVSWLDFKLGLRMLVRYPGLTVVGGLAIAFAICVGAAGFELLTQVARPTLPLEDGHRIVGVRTWDVESRHLEGPTLYDLAGWREELRHVDDVGAFRTLQRNLIVGDGHGEPVQVAEMSASGFRVARVPPLLGRPLIGEDEEPGAPPVAVVGYDVWQGRFGGDTAVLGRRVRLGRDWVDLVGVMPPGFTFPVSHEVWVPLRVGPGPHPPRSGPPVDVFGRLAPGRSLEEAQAELTVLGQRAAAESPDTHEHLRPRLLPYARAVSGSSMEQSLALVATNLFLVMLLTLVCANVALLMFARAATRESEIVVRSALGASRSRIVSQLFAEALVLGSAAAVVGVAAASFALEGWLAVVRAEAGGRLPFWFRDGLSPSTVAYAGVLAVLGALIAGILPAVKLTRGGVQAHLRQSAPGGGSLRFGGVWTAVIIAQVAVTVAFPASAFFVRRAVVAIQSAELPFAPEEYLSARLEIDGETLAGASEGGADELPTRLRTGYEQLQRSLASEPGVLGVTFAERLPLSYHSPRRIEVDGEVAAPADSAARLRVGFASVAVDYFEVMGVPVRAGRGFHQADAAGEPGVVVVNESFVDVILGGRNAVGRHVRYVGRPGDPPGPWHEVVGVVPDMGMINDPSQGAGIYHPATADVAHPLYLAVRTAGHPQALSSRLRATAAAIDPALRLHEIMPLDGAGFRMWSEAAYGVRLLLVVSAVSLLLALAGIYAVMSFTVSRRTREIGIRVALGANAPRVALAVFRRPLSQVGLGLLAGAALVAALMQVFTELSPRELALMAGYMALMVLVCTMACVVPTRRALRVEPTEALRQE